jgi:hypothetical protein
MDISYFAYSSTWRNLQIVFQSRYIIHMPTSNAWRFLFLYSSPILPIAFFKIITVLSRYEAASHYSLHLHFPNNQWCWVPTPGRISHLYIFGQIFKSFLHFTIGLFVSPFLFFLNFPFENLFEMSADLKNILVYSLCDFYINNFTILLVYLYIIAKLAHLSF